MATLVVIIDGQETTHELKEGQTLIGRHPDCAIAISQPSVSGRHAKIHGEGGEFACRGHWQPQRNLREPATNRGTRQA